MCPVDTQNNRITIWNYVTQGAGIQVLLTHYFLTKWAKYTISKLKYQFFKVLQYSKRVCFLQLIYLFIYFIYNVNNLVSVSDRHMPVHNNMAKPYECDVCGWKFHLLHNMERHKATHEKGKKAKVPPHKRMKRKFKKKKKKAAAAPEDATKNTKDSTDVKETTTKVETKAKIKEFSNEFSDEDEVLKDDHQSDDDELPSDLDEDELDDAQLDTSNEAIEETDDLCTTKDEEDAEQPKDDTNEDIESSPTPHSNMDSKEETRSSPL